MIYILNLLCSVILFYTCMMTHRNYHRADFIRQSTVAQLWLVADSISRTLARHELHSFEDRVLGRIIWQILAGNLQYSW